MVPLPAASRSEGATASLRFISLSHSVGALPSPFPLSVIDHSPGSMLFSPYEFLLYSFTRLERGADA